MQPVVRSCSLHEREPRCQGMSLRTPWCWDIRSDSVMGTPDHMPGRMLENLQRMLIWAGPKPSDGCRYVRAIPSLCSMHLHSSRQARGCSPAIAGSGCCHSSGGAGTDAKWMRSSCTLKLQPSRLCQLSLPWEGTWLHSASLSAAHRSDQLRRLMSSSSL